MKLYEKEAKEILEKRGLKVPAEKGRRYVVKAQILANDRASDGGVKFAEDREEADRIAEKMKGREVQGQKVEEVLIEEQVDIEEEFYISILYDTDHRKPMLLFSMDGGTGVEDREVEKMVLEQESSRKDFEQFLQESDHPRLPETLEKLYRIFLEMDARLLEINPLAVSEGELVVIDAMIELEDDAAFRHDWDYPERSVMEREKTDRERRAEKIDQDDHRGVAGKYTELEGDIGMMLAGGGASLTNMDALIEYGGKPANYTEYGGNPPTEKVYRLSKVIMDKPGLKGLWHVGGTANNTDIYRTMKGFCQALKEEKPDYPIVVRRDGPNADRGFDLLRMTKEELGLDMKLFRNDTPMTLTAKTLMEMIEND